MVYPYTGRMPHWAILPLFIFGCTCVVPLFVLGLTGGNWRRAFEAWCQFVAVLLVLAVPALVVGACTALFAFRG